MVDASISPEFGGIVAVATLTPVEQGRTGGVGRNSMIQCLGNSTPIGNILANLSYYYPYNCDFVN